MLAFTQSTAENGVTLTHFIYIAKSHFKLKGFTIGTIGILDLEIFIRIIKNTPPQEKASLCKNVSKSIRRGITLTVKNARSTDITAYARF